MNILLKNCRLCYEKLGKVEIFAEKDLLQKIFDTLRLKISDKSNECLPQKICDDCHKTILDFYTFKQQITNTNEVLKQNLCRKRTKISKSIDDAAVLQEEQSEKVITVEKVKKELQSSELQTSSDEKYICFQCNVDLKDCENYKKHKCIEHIEENEQQIENVIIPKVLINVKEERSDEIINLKDLESDRCVENESNGSIASSGEEESEVETIRKTVSAKRRKIRRTKFQCETCNEIFAKMHTLKVHKKKEKHFICTFDGCNDKFDSAKHLYLHSLKHQENYNSLCITCGKFVTKNFIYSHEKAHNESMAHECNICNMKFGLIGTYKKHMNTTHKGKKFVCAECGFSCLSGCNFSRHMKIHTGVKEFVCDICSKSFYTRAELKKHKRYHDGLRLYKCTYCFKQFIEAGYLTVHLRLHTGERPYVCKFPGCEKAFVCSSKLKSHSKTHKAKNI